MFKWFKWVLFSVCICMCHEKHNMLHWWEWTQLENFIFGRECMSCVCSVHKYTCVCVRVCVWVCSTCSDKYVHTCCQVFNMENYGLDVYVRLGVPHDESRTREVSAFVYVLLNVCMYVCTSGCAAWWEQNKRGWCLCLCAIECVCVCVCVCMIVCRSSGLSAFVYMLLSVWVYVCSSVCAAW